MAALAGLRVVELGEGVSAPYASKLLGDLGADVVKVEASDGDSLRRYGPWGTEEDQDPARGGGLFRYLNGGKRSAVLTAGQTRRLLAGADVVIESLGPGRLEAAGWGLADLEASGFRGALVRVSDFGQDGPYRDLPACELTVQAMGGWVSSHGIPGHDPVQVGGRLPEYVAGSFAGCAALTAAIAARTLGHAVTVDLSMLECLVGTLPYPMLFQLTLSALGLPPPEWRYSVLPGIVRCADGWAGINALTGQHWQDICAMVGADEFAGAQRDLGWGGHALERFFAAVQPFFDTHTVEEVVELGQAFRIPAAPVGNGASVTGFSQFRQRAFFVREDDGQAVVPGPPYRLSRTPAAAGRTAPRLGADTAQVLAELGRTDAEPPGAGGQPPPDASGRPLAGLRVVDLGTFWAGPYAGLYLASMGADVVKIESVERPDGFRFSAAFPQEGDDWYERSGLWQATNLGKRDVTLDLSRPEGLELLRRLIGRADVLIENFSARVLDQFGLGYDAVRELAPGIIMVRMPGFGLDGPWRDYVGWAMGFEQASGMAQITGDGTRPINPGGFLDPVVGMHAALAIQAALEHRRRTGEGQMIEVAQVETGLCLTAEQVIAWSLSSEVQCGSGNRSPGWAPQGVYRCADGPPPPPYPGAPESVTFGGTRRFVALAVRDDAEWAGFVAALGRPAWATAAALDSVEGRRAAHDAIDAGITAWTSGRSPAEVVSRLRPLGIPVSCLLTTDAMYDDPQLVARGYYQSVDHPVTGPRRYPRWPMRMSFGPPEDYHGPAPTLGQHNDEVLGGVLGLDAGEIGRLRRAGVIGERMRR